MSVDGRVFVDTNILLYARDRSEPEKQKVAEACLAELWDRRNGCVSVQVLNEFYVNATQKLKPGMKRDDAWEVVEALATWNPITLDMPLISRGFILQDRYRLSFWDALIVAAAELGGCVEIISEDLSDGVMYAGVRVRNPFASLNSD